MTDTTQQESIASGWNVALVSLVRWTSILVNGEPLPGVKSLPLYDDGNPKIRGDGLVTDIGYAEAIWECGFLYFDMYYYLRSTYCTAGGRTGFVTIYTNLLGNSVYTRMNAVIEVPTPHQLQAEYRFQKVPITFHRLKVPTA